MRASYGESSVGSHPCPCQDVRLCFPRGYVFRCSCYGAMMWDGPNGNFVETVVHLQLCTCMGPRYQDGQGPLDPLPLAICLIASLMEPCHSSMRSPAGGKLVRSSFTASGPWYRAMPQQSCFRRHLAFARSAMGPSFWTIKMTVGMWRVGPDTRTMFELPAISTPNGGTTFHESIATIIIIKIIARNLKWSVRFGLAGI